MARIIISKKELIYLYWKKGLSPYKIADLYNCSFSTVTNRMKDHKIPFRDSVDAKMKYKKFNFSGNLEEKAYLLGFALGDLSVCKKSVNSKTIVVRCHTTNDTQVRIIEKMFEKYGKVTVSTSKYGANINCFLDLSFDFLLGKKDYVGVWINEQKEFGLAFLAGYTDAEGSFGINQGRGRFKIDSYDKNILNWAYKMLVEMGILAKIRMIGKRGELRSDGTYFKKDLWRLTINKADSLYKFIGLIRFYLKHGKRRKDMFKVYRNVKLRKKRGTV